MEDFLQKIFLENTVRLYLEVFGSILLALIVKRFISKYLAGLLFKWFTKAGKTFHKEAFLKLVVGPLEVFLFLFIVVIALDKLTLPSVLRFTVLRKVQSADVLSAIAYGAIIISFIRLCLRFINFIALILEEKANRTEDQADNQLIVFFRDFFKIVLFIIGVLLVLHFCFNYNVGNLLTGLSIVGAAIALATKESLENLIASFIIFFDKPFITGDVVKVQGFNGTVEKIGLRSTRIRTDHKTYITVPNKQMVDSILDNITMRTQRRADIFLEIGLSANAADIKKIITATETILKKDKIENTSVFFSDTGKNAHIITVTFFTAMSQSLDEFNNLRTTINLEIINMLQQNNIELAAASTDIKIANKN